MKLAKKKEIRRVNRMRMKKKSISHMHIGFNWCVFFFHSFGLFRAFVKRCISQNILGTTKLSSFLVYTKTKRTKKKGSSYKFGERAGIHSCIVVKYIQAKPFLFGRKKGNSRKILSTVIHMEFIVSFSYGLRVIFIIIQMKKKERNIGFKKVKRK